MELKETSNGIKFTYNGHPSQFRGYIVETIPNRPSVFRKRVFDCRTSTIRVTEDFKSAGNMSIFAIIDGQDVQVLPYGLSVRKSLEAFKRV